MITVRFPTGFSVQYNSANFIDGPDQNGVIRLRKEQGDTVLIARVPRECIIELTSPCRAYNAALPSTELEQEVRLLRKKVEALSRKLGKAGK